VREGEAKLSLAEVVTVGSEGIVWEVLISVPLLLAEKLSGGSPSPQVV